MCGICGIVTDNQYYIKNSLYLMNKAITHRGPDDEGYFEKSNTGLAMRRLSIIDLETGHQPIYSYDNRLVIVFNGEIYNFKELKFKYLGDYSFKTNSDTEVVLNLYHKMGTKCLEFLRGIFAFAIYDNLSNQLIIARDHIGVKPIFYYIDEHTFLFSSDIISFHSLPFIDLSINPGSICDYLRFGYIPQPGTIFSKVHALRPGHFAFINPQLQISVTQYYNLLDITASKTTPELNTCKDHLKSCLHESIKEQLISDVPLGAFLSGGIDSSIISSEMASVLHDPVNTFTIGFHGSSNQEDIRLSSILSSLYKTNHNEQIIKPDLDKVLDKIISSLGQPFAVTSTIPIYINSEIAKEKVKVILSGDGADEVFGGYNRYQRFFRYKNLEWLRFLPLSQINDLTRSFIRFLPSDLAKKAYKLWLDPFFSILSKPDTLYKYLKILGTIDDDHLKSILQKDFAKILPITDYANEFALISDKNGLSLNSLMMFDVQTSLVDEMLFKVDFASMLASLEVRVPFLDHRIVEYGLSLPEKYKINHSTNKWILKETYKNQLPLSIIEAPKRGFNLPLDNWISKHWSQSFITAFNSELLDDLNIERSLLLHQFNKYLIGYPINGKIFYYIFILIKWYENLKNKRSTNEI